MKNNRYLMFAIKLIKHPRQAFYHIVLRTIKYRASDKTFKKIFHRAVTGRKMNFENPRSFSEKIHILSLLYKDRPDITELVDKYAVRRAVALKAAGLNGFSSEFTDRTANGHLTYNECGLLVPLIEMYESFDEIDFDLLPDKFVLKCTHDSASVVICNGKADFDFDGAREKLTKALEYNFWEMAREYQYKDVPHRIICEKHLGDNINDYKIFVFDGKATVVQVDFDRFSAHKRNLYDLDWNLLPFLLVHPNDLSKVNEKPEKLKEMLSLAELLMDGVNAPHCRIDFYYIDNEILFSEMTFTHGAGAEKFYPYEWDVKFGDMISI